MIKIKDDVFDRMKARGFNTVTAKKTGWFAASTMKAIKNGQSNVSLRTIDQICILLGCPPEDVIEFTITEQDKKDLAEMIVKSL